MSQLNNKSVFIIAEISANHGQNFKRAVELIKKAKECRADAVKFQAYTPETLTIDAKNRYFLVNHPKWGGQTLYDLYKKAYTPLNWLKKLKKIADDCGITFFATAFDKHTVDILEEINVPLHKIASFELIDLPLIEYAAKTKKPIIMSTGMATLAEIKEAFNAAKNSGAKSITLLKCVSSYPAQPEDMNLNTITDMKKRFKCRVGLSDHTLGIAMSVASVSLGAEVIEKHITLSRKIKTVDNFFSIEPGELKELVENIRIVEKSLGSVAYQATKQERQNRCFRRSLFAVQDIKKGDISTMDNVRSIRPAYGLAPKYFKKILGMTAVKNIKKGTPLRLDMFKRPA